MQSRTIQYTANYGRFRNMSGNWLYQQCSQEPVEEYKFRKKQYPVKKCQIQKYKMLNAGETFLPKVSDLILDVSDIPGTHTDTIKSEAVRNRLIAKEMRENREREAKSEDKVVEVARRPRLVRAGNSLPKQSYHYTQMKANPERVRTEEDGVKQDLRAGQRVVTLPDGSQDAKEKYYDEYLKNVNTTMAARVSQQTTPKALERPLSKSSKNGSTAKKLVFVETGKNTLCPDRFREKKDIKSTIQQRIRVLTEGRTPKPVKPNIDIEAYDIVANGFKSRRGKIDSDLTQHRLSRINPTFLSFGSEYLYDANNYLAHYRNRSVIG